MGSTIKIAVGQMCSSSNLQRNARVVHKLIDSALEMKARVLFLPEAADYISRDPAHSIQLAKNSKSDFIESIQQKLRSVYAKEQASGHGEQDEGGICVAVGVHEPTSGELADKKVFNSQLWISNKGEIVQRYHKIHLFDINIPNGPIMKESNSVEPGNVIVHPFAVSEKTHPGFQVGLSICYDIRFPYLATRMRELGANILTYPSAFTTRTGEAHWMELGRARAIDSQCYVIMAAQCGEHDVYADLIENEDGVTGHEKRKKRVSYGQSLVIGPWGEVLGKARKYSEVGEGDVDSEGDYYEILGAELALDHVEKVRTDLPVFSHRRPDVLK